jgi:2-succinyl-6-hydroxy-2,4-cyclohexadiene-1-carboxylate synthase
MLHGFAGTARAFDGVIAALHPERYSPLALNLLGHGSASRGPITFEDCVERVLAVSPPRFALCGYSLGGRIAQQLALAAPERIERLVLVSTSPGIEDEQARRERIESDEQLARELEQSPFERFIERWRSQPLFAADPPEVRELASADHRRNDPLALASAMRGLSTGRMAPLWERLPQLALPVMLLAGERDTKYVAIAQRMAALLPDAELRILAGGHSLLLESPRAVADAIAAAPVSS